MVSSASLHGVLALASSFFHPSNGLILDTYAVLG